MGVEPISLDYESSILADEIRRLPRMGIEPISLGYKSSILPMK